MPDFSSLHKAVGLPAYKKQMYAHRTKSGLKIGNTRSKVGKQVAEMLKTYISEVSECIFSLSLVS